MYTFSLQKGRGRLNNDGSEKRRENLYQRSHEKNE